MNNHILLTLMIHSERATGKRVSLKQVSAWLGCSQSNARINMQCLEATGNVEPVGNTRGQTSSWNTTEKTVANHLLGYYQDSWLQYRWKTYGY